MGIIKAVVWTNTVITSTNIWIH